jgi:hypothetical protein
MWRNVWLMGNLTEFRRKVAAGLHHRTLCPSSDNICSCGDANVFEHGENCPYLLPFTTARHKIIKRQMISTLVFNPSLTVFKTTSIANSSYRIDFQVTSHAGISKYNLMIIPVDPKEARQLSNRARRELSTQTPSLPMLDLTKASFQTILNKPAQIKIVKHTSLLKIPYIPLVISLGYGGELGDGGMEGGDWGGESSVLDVAELDRAGESEGTVVIVRVRWNEVRR